MTRKPLIPTFFLLAGLAGAAAWNFGLPGLIERPPTQRENSEAIQAVTAPLEPAAPAEQAAVNAPLPDGFAEEAAALGRVTDDGAADEARLAALAAKLDRDSAHSLASVALSQDRAHTDRFLAAYLLGLRAGDFPGELETIASSDDSSFHHRPPSHTFHESNWHFEISIRVAALASLDRSPDRARAAAFFQKVEESHSSDTVRKVARVGRVGAERNEALIDSYLTAKAEGALRDATQD